MSAAGKRLSVFIITHNEIERLEATLRALQPLDPEIIVVDSGSTDGTVELARRYTPHVHHRDWTGYGPQKVFAEGLCTGEWLFNLDADEVLSEGAQAEVAAAVAVEQDAHDVYDVRIIHVGISDEGARRFAPVNRTPRLYRRGKAYFSDSLALDKVQVPEGTSVGVIRSPVWHRSLKSFGHMWDKAGSYAKLQARERFAKGKRPSVWGVIPGGIGFFLKQYFLRRMFVLGVEGFVQAATLANARMIRDMEIRRLVRESGEG